MNTQAPRRWWANEVFQREEGVIVRWKRGVSHSSTHEIAFVPVYLQDDYLALQRELSALQGALTAAQAEILKQRELNNAIARVGVAQTGELLALQEALRREWQPIETAPKDGTPILLASLGVENTGWMVHVACWMCKTHSHISVGNPCPVADDCDMGWYAALAWIGGEQTHWMPLPPPPAQQESGSV